MLSISRTGRSFLFTLLLFIPALGQTPPQTLPPGETKTPIDVPPSTKEPEPPSQASTVIVTATATHQRVRYISIGEVHRTRLQVFSADGSQVFDSSFRLGNLIDWKLSDQQGQRLPDGSYLFLVTARDFAERLTQKYGTTTLEQGQVYLEQTSRDELPPSQTTALEANRLAEVISPVNRIGAAGLNETVSATTDGGNGIDAAPQGKDTTTSQSTSGTVNISGTGTQNRIAKWMDNAGTLGDSNIFEDAAGYVGIGTNAPGGQFHIFGTAGQDVFAGMGPDLINGPALNFGYAGSSFGRGAGFFNVRPDASATAPNPSLRFATGNVQRMIITNTGNLGIGTTTPSHHLSINGGPLWTTNQWSGAVEMTNGSAIGWQANNGGQRFGIGQSNGGLYFFRTASNPGTTTSPANYAMVINDSGNIGIGTITPTTPLYVLSSTPGLSAIYGESASGRGVWGKSVGSRGVFGEADTGEGVHGQSNSGNGAVGGSTTGTGVYGESAATNTVAQAGVYGKGTGSGGIGVTGEANVNNAIGVFGLSSSASGFPLYARNTGGGFGLYSENNVGQNRDKGGFVKAMLYVQQDGVILRCYNGITGASTGNCGFSISKPGSTAVFDITFNFQVNDRFISVTARNPLVADTNVGAAFYIDAGFPNLIEVMTYLADGGQNADANFMIIVF